MFILIQDIRINNVHRICNCVNFPNNHYFWIFIYMWHQWIYSSEIRHMVVMDGIDTKFDYVSILNNLQDNVALDTSGILVCNGRNMYSLSYE